MKEENIKYTTIQLPYTIQHAFNFLNNVKLKTTLSITEEREYEQLKKFIANLQQELSKKDSIIKEAKEYIKTQWNDNTKSEASDIFINILSILDRSK